MAENELRFEFGRNWQEFISSNLTRERIDIAKKNILSFTGREDLSGLRIADIGSGSGLHSLAMFEAGAGEIISIDYDPNSVASTAHLRELAGSPPNWTVMQGSALDPAFLGQLGKFDFVYCWGVLHHTGDVWAGLDNVAAMVAPTGIFHVALYDSDIYPEGAEFWLRIKQDYTAGSSLRRRAYELWYVLSKILRWNPMRIPEIVRQAREYKASRGMALYTDIKDWLGGWPMEFTRIYEVIARMQGCSLQLLRTKVGEGNTEYLFGGPQLTAETSGYSPIPLPSPVGWSVTSLRLADDFRSLAPNAPVYVYGAGRAGELVHDAVRKTLGRTPAGFITTSQSGRLRDLPIVPLAEFLRDKPKDAEIIVAGSHFDAMSYALVQNGIQRFYNGYPYVLNALQGKG